MDQEKIIQFPTDVARSLADLQRILSEYIPDEGMRTFIYERLSGRWAAERAHPLSLQIDPSEYARVKEIADFFRESNHRLFFELIKAYAELYEAERR